MIEKARIEAVKQGVDLAQLIRSRGIELTKKGRNFAVRTRGTPIKI